MRHYLKSIDILDQIFPKEISNIIIEYKRTEQDIIDFYNNKDLPKTCYEIWSVLNIESCSATSFIITKDSFHCGKERVKIMKIDKMEEFLDSIKIRTIIVTESRGIVFVCKRFTMDYLPFDYIRFENDDLNQLLYRCVRKSDYKVLFENITFLRNFIK